MYGHELALHEALPLLVIKCRKMQVKKCRFSAVNTLKRQQFRFKIRKLLILVSFPEFFRMYQIRQIFMFLAFSVIFIQSQSGGQKMRSNYFV